MRAWCSVVFGKPLLCVIASPEDARGYCFEDVKSDGKELAAVEVFPRDLIIGVE